MKDNSTITGVGFSRQLDARTAGREIASSLLKDMDSIHPDIVLLYTSIHYKDHGGFQELLNGIYEILPSSTQLIGGTTAGFIIPQGVFVSGGAAFGIKSINVDFSIAIEKNIKRHPNLSAINAAKIIKHDLENSKFKNRFVLTHASGITTPKIPFFPENLRIIHNKQLSWLLKIGTYLSLWFLQKGPGREEEIIEILAEKLPEYNMIGGSFVDDNKGYFNFQFHNKQFGTNWLVTLGIATDYDISVKSSFGLSSTERKFNITKKSLYGLVIEKINNKSPFEQINKIMNWPKEFLVDNARILRRTFYNPIGYEINGKQYVSVMAFIFGESIMVSPKIRCEEVCIMNTTGRELIESVEENLADTREEDIKFAFITSCIARLETLGREVYQVHGKLLKHFNGKPFIQMYAVGEDVYTKELGAKHIAESYNTAIFYKKKEAVT
jgi:hypothetical protein